MFKENFYPSYKIEKNKKTGERTLIEIKEQGGRDQAGKKADLPDKEILESAGSYIFEGQKPVSRRDFLKYGLGSLAGIFILKKFGTIEKAIDVLSEQKENIGELRKHFPGKIEFVYDDEEEVDLERAESELNDLKIKEASPLKMKFDEPINIGIEELAKAKNYWKERYTRGNLKKDFEESLIRMKPYEKKLKKIFRENGVPEDLIYISIAESFFDPKRRSRAGAEGAFQLMPKTARDYHLVVNEKIDERKDILKSAEAAAKILKDNYAASGDWDMAFSGYNWGKFWQYPELKKEKSFEKYVRHFSHKSENIRRQIHNAKFIRRTVTKSDNLYKLARLYGLSEKEILKFNRKRNNLIREGEVLKIPLKDKKQREHIFNMEIAGYQENFNYVPKVRAVLEAVKEYS